MMLSDVCLTSDVCRVHLVGGRRVRLTSKNKACGSRHNMPPPPASWHLTFWLWKWCQIYVPANYSLPRPVCSRLRPDVRNRQTDRQTDVTHHFIMPLGRVIIMNGDVTLAAPRQCRRASKVISTFNITGRIAARWQTASIKFSQRLKTAFSRCRAESLHQFMYNLAWPSSVWVRLAVQNFTPIGARGWVCGPQNV